jgi:hypothetical protein
MTVGAFADRLNRIEKGHEAKELSFVEEFTESPVAPPVEACSLIALRYPIIGHKA